MLPTDNFTMLGSILYGAVFLLATAICSTILGAYGATLCALLALALCYLHMTAFTTRIGGDSLYTTLFWIELVLSFAAALLLAYNLIQRI
jgi:hypothetical protein